MIPIEIDPVKCERCADRPCISDCPADCLDWDKEKTIPYVAYPDECSFCGNCRISCQYGAIEIIFPMSMII